jgi:carboxymethylenebutenolidase
VWRAVPGSAGASVVAGEPSSHTVLTVGVRNDTAKGNIQEYFDMKVFKRILLGLLVVLVVLILALPLSIFVDALLGANRLDALANTTVAGIDGGPDVRAYVAKPAGAGPFPTVIMVHEFYGLSESIVGKADLLAQAGYLVIAPDTFRGVSTSWIPSAIYQVMTTKPEDVNTDLDSIYAWLETQPAVDSQRIAVVGFCYGGRAALVYSLHNTRLATTVIFYGAPETNPEVLKSLPGPVLGIFGEKDQSIAVEDVKRFDEALTTANVPHEITIYAGQPHAFVGSVAAIKAGGAQGEAWAQMIKFLEKNLKNASVQQHQNQPTAYQAPFAWKYYAMLVYEHAFGTANHHHP